MSDEKRQEMTGGTAPLREYNQDLELMRYWLSRPVSERLAEVERLRRMYIGESEYGSERELRRFLTGGVRPLR
jgi:hypothetical protein